MDLKQFEQAVFAGAAPSLKELPGVLPAAIYETVKNSGGRLDDSAVRDTLARAGQLDKETRAALAPKPDATSGKEPGIKHTLRAQDSLKRLTAWAERLREEGFGQTDPPYKTVEDAADRRRRC